MLDVRDEVRKGKKSVLVVSATGSGKTCIAATMMSNAVRNKRRVWFLVHRRELLKQSIDTLEYAAGVATGVIASGFGANSVMPAQVASIQTLMRRWERYPLPDLLIVDEAHHACSASWSKLISDIKKKSPGILVIGQTASPQRLDGRGLGQWFECIVQGPSVTQLIADGHLANYRLWGSKLPDLTGVHTVAGDYNKQDLAAAMSRTAVVGDALAEYKKHCDGKRALVFMWSIQSSKDLALRFNDAGIPAMHVDGETDDATRDRAVRSFRSGTIKVLSNVDLFGEGFDVPAAEVGFLMRPTQSLAMYLQQCGRLLRPFPGKDAALIFDHAGLVVRHGFPDDPREWSLEGSDTRGKKKQESPVRQCIKCYATLPVWAKACKWCGFVFESKPRKMNVEDGELTELAKVDKLWPSRDRQEARTYDELLAVEKRKGYRRGWADHVFAAREMKRRLLGKES